MEKIKNILTETLKKRRFHKKVKENLVLVHWREIVGDELVRHTEPSYIKNGILFVNVANSMWAHHLTFLKREIIGKINNKVGKRIVRDIRFRSGNINSVNITLNNDIKAEKHLTDVQITKEEERLINSFISNIEDNEIKALMKNIIKADFEKKKRNKVLNKNKES
ncbi:MAG TPA: DUF721 domain-containing protein [Thermoanaerobacterales bacterium]|nr:DUF721 domain-containing protein [Thermoanaerobacterales bacterium]